MMFIFGNFLFPHYWHGLKLVNRYMYFIVRILNLHDHKFVNIREN